MQPITKQRFGDLWLSRTRVQQLIKTFLAVLLSGTLLGLSQPLVIRRLGETPVNSSWIFGLLCLVGYVPLLHSMRNRSPRRCFVLGFAVSSVQLLIIIHWVVVAMAVFGGVSFLPSCAVSVLLAMVFAVHTGAACGMTALITRALGWPVWAVFPPVLCAWEWLRNFTLFDGFPWGNVGYSLGSVSVLRQAAALVGTYGLIFFIGLVNSCIAWAGDPKSRGARRTPVLFTAAVMGAVLSWGVYRLSVSAPFEQKVRVALLQGNIEQGIKNRAAYYGSQILRKYVQLERRAIAQGAELLIWPEAAYPGTHRHEALTLVGLQPVAASRVVGVVVRQGDQYYNSAVVLNPRGQVVGRMDKNHMVPFGEYVPWPLRSIVKRLVPAAGNFPEVIDKTPVPVDIPLPPRGLAAKGSDESGHFEKQSRIVRLGAAICFDGVFPEVSRAFVRRGAELLINITNDAWFGVSSATFQHLGMYVMRSTELGRAYARAANTGVSAWVDARGRVHQPTRLYEDGLVVADIPLVTEITPYARFGDVVPALCALFTLFAGLAAALGPFWRTRRSLVAWVAGGVGFVTAGSTLSFLAYRWSLLSEANHTQGLLLVLAGLWLGWRAWRARPMHA